MSRLAAAIFVAFLLADPAMAQGARQVEARQLLEATVRSSLQRAPTEGSDNSRPIYIEFESWVPGVSFPPRIRDELPTTITVVLQYNYSDLQAGPDAVRVKLSFDGEPWLVVIPYKAIYAFQDLDIRISLPPFEAYGGDEPADRFEAESKGPLGSNI